MERIPLPTGTDTLARYLASLKEDIHRAQPRRLGKSSITDGTLEVAAGGAIRVRRGARLIIEDGGALITDAAATTGANMGTASDYRSVEAGPVSIGAAWTPVATIKLASPKWAGRVTIRATAHISGASNGTSTDVKARITVDDSAGPETFATWDSMGTSLSWSGAWITRSHVNGDNAIEVKIEAFAGMPGMLSAQTRARLDIDAKWEV